MDEIKIENSLNVICHGCLSNDRRTSPLEGYAETFGILIGSQKQNLIYGEADIKLCWECIALLKKFKSFQMQLKKAQDVLVQMLYELDYNPIPLSKLSTVNKYYYDSDIQHIETTPTKKKKRKNIELEIFVDAVAENLPVDNIDIIKEESSDFEGNLVIDTFDDDICENKEFEIEAKDEIENDAIESESKPQRAKRRKLVKSRDNSVSYYKQYARMIEREKIDWGKVENYFTMISFSEAEMEEHFLSKERKFSECTRFKHKCVECELGYLRSFDLKRHNDLNHYNPDEPIKCSLCHRSQSSISALERHWRSHTPVAKCRMCGDVCRPRGMKNHLNYAHTSKYACRFCNLTFGKILHFSHHYKEMHQNYICDYCNQCCKSKILVEKHIRTHHTKFTCKDCNRLYPNYRQYKRHCNEMHPNKYKERPELAYCVECDRQYGSVSKYKKHLKISPKHTEVKRILLPCPDCGKIFKRKNYLNNHYNLYHAKKSKHYCELCDKYFANGYGLRKHKTHVHLKISRVKDKMCDLCGRGFATNRILLNHRRTHTGERPYQCPFCAAAFTQKQAMHSHCRTQHKDIK